MKNLGKKNVPICMVFGLIVIMIIFIMAHSFDGSTGLGSILSNREEERDLNILSDEETGTFHNVSDGGAIIYAYDSIPAMVIEGAKKYIKDNGYDDKELSFNFANSYYNSYRLENIFAAYQSEEPAEKVETSNETLFYVEEIYSRDNHGGIGVGYFTINEDGIVKETKSLRKVEELAKYTIEPNIGNVVTLRAREILSLDSDVDVNSYDSHCFFYEDSGEVVLCYWIRFEDGSEVYINGITGEKIK